MKTIIDEKNRAVIVKGTVFGKRVKGIAVTHGEDEFDVEFGMRLAKAKYKANKYFTKGMSYTKRIKELQHIINACEKEQEQLEQYARYCFDKSCDMDTVVMEVLSEKY
jgi:hypothetical protein